MGVSNDLFDSQRFSIGKVGEEESHILARSSQAINFFPFFSLFFCRHHYRSKTAAFIWMIVLISSMHLVFAWILFATNFYRVMFLGPSFSFSIVYIWSRKAQHVQMNFLGLFSFQAPYLPLVILGFGTVLGQVKKKKEP